MSLVQLLLDGESSNDASEEQSNEQQLVSDFSTEKQIQMELSKVMEQIPMELKSKVEPLIKSAFENIIHGRVKEEIKLATERRSASMNWNPENEICTSEPRSLKLQFVNKISALILTRNKIVGEEFAPLKIALVDGLTDEVVNFGPEASAKVQLVVLGADSDGINGDVWTPEEFDSKIVRKIKGRNSVLVGNVHLNLKEGIGFVSEVSFTHTSSYMKSCRYRLGAKVVDHFNGIRVKEAKTEPFTLKDYRCTYREKRDSLTPDDEVWRLKGIAKYGPSHNRLRTAKIKTMKDFLVRLFADPQGLKQILNGSDKMWTKTEQLARRCVNDNAVYVYPSPSSEQKTQVVFNIVGEVLGLLLESHYVLIDNVSQTQKIDAQKSVVSAFQHWKDVIHFADHSNAKLAFNDPSNSTRIEAPGGNHVLTSNMVDNDVASTFFPSTSLNMDDIVEAPGGNHVLTSNMVDHDVPSTSFSSISIDMDDIFSYVESHEKRPRKWKVVSWVIKFLTMKRIVAMEEE